jgi:hypothetical protein
MGKRPQTAQGTETLAEGVRAVRGELGRVKKNLAARFGQAFVSLDLGESRVYRLRRHIKR